MPLRQIVVYRAGPFWGLDCEGALFERMARRGEALRVARAHARAAERAGEAVEIHIRDERRPARSSPPAE